VTDLEFIAGLPKAELHMHIEGSIEAELMFALAERNGVALRWPTAEALRAAYTFDNLKGFLDLYYDGCRVLVTAQDFYDVTRAYLRRAHADSVLHAEMFTSPQSHTARGITLATQLEGVFGAMDDAQREDGITSGLLLGAQRHRSEVEAMALFDEAQPWADRLLGFGLGGSELGNPPSKFANFFARCRAAGFKTTAHAGEEGPAAYVRESVELLQVDRLDHGNACMDDAALVAKLVASGIALTLCPLSNLRLQVVRSLASHPLKAMLDAGLSVTVNSDDPSYFGGYINDNFSQIAEALGLNREHLTILARNSFYAAFMSETRRSRCIAALDAYLLAAELHNA
jgi:adenosine deaminase